MRRWFDKEFASDSFSVKPRFKVRPSNTTAYEGYPVMLHCVATGEPTPTIQWDKNSKVNSFDNKRFRVSAYFTIEILYEWRCIQSVNVNASGKCSTAPKKIRLMVGWGTSNMLVVKSRCYSRGPTLTEDMSEVVNSLWQVGWVFTGAHGLIHKALPAKRYPAEPIITGERVMTGTRGTWPWFPFFAGHLSWSVLTAMASHCAQRRQGQGEVWAPAGPIKNIWYRVLDTHGLGDRGIIRSNMGGRLRPINKWHYWRSDLESWPGQGRGSQ